MIYIASGFKGNEYNLNHPRVAWSNAARRATITASGEESGYEAVNAADARTASKWQADTAASTWALALDAPESIAAMCIDSHDMSDAGTSVQMQVSDDGTTWTDLGPLITPTDNSAIMLLVPRKTREYVRASFTGGAAKIGVIFFSDVIEIPQRVYSDVGTPIHMARNIELENNLSIGGHYIGRSVKRKTNYNDFPVRHLKESFVLNTLDPFVKDAVTNPYFLAERPKDYPNAVSYRWRPDVIRFERMGVRDLMQGTL